MKNSRLTFLGQAGFWFDVHGYQFLVDPYLSNLVEEKYGTEYKRKVAPPVSLENLKNVQSVFVTHAHDDHCDVNTLGALLKLNSRLQVIAPAVCHSALRAVGFESAQIREASEQFEKFSNDVEVKAVPAAHLQVTRDSGKCLEAVGYLFRCAGITIYHSGDSIPHESIQAALPNALDLALLPINERNYFREKRGIVGNMTIREALEWVEVLGVKRWIPIHWDMFENNSVFQEELDHVATRWGRRSKIHWLKAGDSRMISEVV
jgi:L-ascorbate metabolism protein UlaG (beta-lactamase superfamily)